MQKADGLIEFSKVEFEYPTRPEIRVLKGLNLIVKPGQMVALVGQSGCGKSTCIQLLQRLYDPLSGAVTLDRRDVTSVSLATLRSQLGVVGQEPVLFDRTIAENIAYGDNYRRVPMEEIIEAATRSNIHSFVSSLPLVSRFSRFLLYSSRACVNALITRDERNRARERNEGLYCDIRVKNISSYIYIYIYDR